MADATTRQTDSRAGRQERTSRSLQEDRLVPVAKNRELETETRPHTTPMAHAQHNRKNTEPDGPLQRGSAYSAFLDGLS